MLHKKTNQMKDDKDGTKLKSNLKSLTKFYDTLNEKKSSPGSGLRRTTSGKSSAITLQSVIDLAKDVSDKMVLSKAKVDYLIYLTIY